MSLGSVCRSNQSSVPIPSSQITSRNINLSYACSDKYCTVLRIERTRPEAVCGFPSPTLSHKSRRFLEVGGAYLLLSLTIYVHFRMHLPYPLPFKFMFWYRQEPSNVIPSRNPGIAVRVCIHDSCSHERATLNGVHVKCAYYLVLYMQSVLTI